MSGTLNKRAVGSRYEDLSCRFLEKKGLRILARNFRGRQGEIDIIARDGDYVVFTEVKYRRTPLSGDGAEAVTKAKQRTICRIADIYRAACGMPDSEPVRFDVITCAPDERGEIQVIWYKNAFPYSR